MKNRKLEKAQQALADALKERPEFIPYQKEVDRRLSKALTLKERQMILQFMIADRLSALGEELSKQPKAVEKQVTGKLIEAEVIRRVQDIDKKGT